jgi:hypothetical protein
MRNDRKTPSYCRQKRKGYADEAFIKIDGHRNGLGRWGSGESRQRHDALNPAPPGHPTHAQAESNFLSVCPEDGSKKWAGDLRTLNA